MCDQKHIVGLTRSAVESEGLDAQSGFPCQLVRYGGLGMGGGRGEIRD